MDPVEILEGMKSDRDLILGRLIARKTDLEKYSYLQETLHAIDVSKDGPFQKAFNGFYKMRTKPTGWYRFFFDILEREKLQRKSSFGDVMREIFDRWNEVHPSFTSKLLATIDPESPVYDREVCRNLGISAVPSTIDPESRMIKAVNNFLDLQQFHSAARDTALARELIEGFDAALTSFVRFTPVKKLDLMLWQWRPIRIQQRIEMR